MNRQIVKIPLKVAGLVFLSACSPLQSNAPPATTYRLQTEEFSAQDCSAQQESTPVLAVSQPDMPTGFDTDQIVVYLDKGQRLDYASAARWPADLDEAIQAFIIAYLQKDCREMIVQAPRFDIPASYRLIVKVHDFQPVYAGEATNAPELRVSMTFILISLPGGKTISSFTLSKKERAPENSLTAITAGLNNLLGEIARTAHDRLLKAVDQGTVF